MNVQYYSISPLLLDIEFPLHFCCCCYHRQSCDEQMLTHMFCSSSPQDVEYISPTLKLDLTF